jgi:hypothetical protein
MKRPSSCQSGGASWITRCGSCCPPGTKRVRFHCMPRITINIDASILKDLKKLQLKKGKDLGRLISELLAIALKKIRDEAPPRQELSWISRPMNARVDLSDQEAVRAALDQGP